MASTNKTTNYNLSQFIGTDKPAWLADYNQDMSKIDTGIHTAQTTATGADGKADANATNIGTLSNLTTETKTSLVGAVNEVQSEVNTAQNTANAANTAAGTANTNIAKFNLSNRATLSPTVNLGSLNTSRSNVQFATDTTNSIFKIYGRVNITNLNGITGNVTLKLGTTSLRPASAYEINSGAIITVRRTDDNWEGIAARNLKVDTDGSIYVIEPNADYISSIVGSVAAIDVTIMPCLYFNTDFGDQ